ncbi:MAG: hypothetical protein A2X99_04955 [Deltaproteobacteria bacterium GWB2_55_19]|nr:MAG: hypothetical protein A2X99_04955 [Deltaproteobacteria bacterium GWB2_55_19]HAO92403.1 hypothetical protein [Deltaproteobacteria bacterium]
MGAKDEIELLDSKIARLKVEYEQYFMRVLKREPAKLRDEVDKLVLFYSNKNLTNTSLRFKYNTIVAKYNSYKQYWTRTLRAIEEGEFHRKAEGELETGARSAPIPPEARRPAPNAAPGAGDDVREVYEKYIEARKACNEPTEGITLGTLEKTLQEYKKKVAEQYKTEDVEFKVAIKDGKAKLTIAPKKKAG